MVQSSPAWSSDRGPICRTVAASEHIVERDVGFVSLDDVDNDAWTDLISDHSVLSFVLCRRHRYRVPCPTRPTSLPRQHQHHIRLVEAAAH